MKFSKLSTVLSILSVVLSADAIADPNSAVVKLNAKNFSEFIESNPLVLAEFFAPWCGHCKNLGPEYSSAADILKETHPGIKLAQVDCTEEEDLCRNFGIKGYPTLKVLRGKENIDDYEGSREASGIVDYMIKQSLPAVQVAETVADFLSLIGEQTKPFVVQLADGDSEDDSSIFNSVAETLRKDYTFISTKGQEAIESLAEKYFEFKPKDYLKKISHIVIHPDSTIIPFSAELSKESLVEFIKNESVPYFGDINRDTYMMYMDSPTPLAYYFYTTQEQRDEVEEFFNKLGKKFRGKVNFVGLDATLFGRHAELLNMNPDVLPLFAIQDTANNKKYGVDQTEFPEGPSVDAIEDLVEKFVAGEAQPIIKSEPLPTDEEQAANGVYTLVAHNHDELLNDTSKDVFVKYYAHWCGHCQRLAPTWEELGKLYKSAGSDVVIAKIDHSKNDVETSIPIEGYPTLLLYPANGEIDEKTGLRIPVVYNGPREFDNFIEFIKEEGGLKVDGTEFKKAEDQEEEPAKDAEEAIDHDEL